MSINFTKRPQLPQLPKRPNKLRFGPRWTRDAVEPLHPGDPEMFEGWRCVPVPPDNSGRWFIFDITSKDYATGWARLVCDDAHLSSSKLIPWPN